MVRHVAGPPATGPSERWSVDLDDPQVGTVRLTGRLRRASGSSTILVLVHGLGGSSESSYMLRTADAAESFGLSTLRLSLRGADGRGEDLYHGGLSGDLASVLGSPELAPYARVLLFGFSLGGHLSLRFATEAGDPRLGAVAAACAPLDLERSVAAIDRPVGWLYRRYVLAGLSRMYAEVSARREMPLAPDAARRIRTLREWDRRTVVPRFGFAGAGDYYARASVAGRTDRLRVPALLVAAEDDPMVMPDAVHPGLGRASDHLCVRWVRHGGHLAFPAGLDLGEDAPRGLAGQAIGWLARQ